MEIPVLVQTMKSSFIAWAVFTEPIGPLKETTLARADLTLQLSMFVTAEKEGEMFIIFFLSSFCQLLSPQLQAMASWVRADHESSHQPA